MADHLDDALAAAGAAADGPLDIFRYGSWVYGTRRPDSDQDLVVVADGVETGTETRHGPFDLHFRRPEDFAAGLAAHRIDLLECLFLPDDMVLRRARTFPFTLDRGILRSSVMAKASHAWSKAAKKLTVEPDAVLVGRKSLFHALRILAFGIQIAKDGRITDYAAANPLLAEIMAQPAEWDILKACWQPRFNALASEFRRLAPKG